MGGNDNFLFWESELLFFFLVYLSQENEDKLTVVKVDHDANPRLIEEYKIYGLPTLIIFKNGKEVSGSRREGAITKDKLKDYINKHMESVSIV